MECLFFYEKKHLISIFTLFQTSVHQFKFPSYFSDGINNLGIKTLCFETCLKIQIIHVIKL